MLRPFASLVLAAFVLIGGCSSSNRASSGDADPQAVATIAGNPIRFEEIRSEYRRSAGMAEDAPEDTVAAYVDFLDRYVNYRLKVLEAEAVGLHRDPETVAEIERYRRQYARPYLLDRVVVDPLVREAHARRLESVDVSHILIEAPPTASPADTLAAYRKLEAIVDSIRAGADFAEMAMRHSSDRSARTRPGPGYRGRLGFISGGVTVKPFEDAAYNTPVGELSDIVRSRFGYHIVKVHDRRTTPPDVRISHIMITPAPNRTPADTAEALARLDTVMTRLEAGADFASLAAIYSDDKRSGASGGDLGFINFGRGFVQPMKDVAFAMDSIGAVSDPVLTDYGYHLIKLTGRQEQPSLEESYDELKQQVGRLPEAASGERAYADSMLVVRGATVDSALVDRYLDGYTADSLRTLDPYPDAWGAAVIGSIQDSSYTLRDFVARTRWNLLTEVENLDDAGIRRRALRDFMRDRAIDYEMAALELTDADYARTIREFRNGILLFSLMEDSVWNAAAQDTAALERLYNEDPGAYRYPERTIVVSVFSTSSDLVVEAVSAIERGSSPAAAVDSLKNAGSIKVDTTYVVDVTNSIYDRAIDQPVGAFTEPIAYNGGYIALSNAGVDPPRAKTFEEARAELINIMQERRETELVSRLRAKYRAETYPDRLRAMLGAAPTRM